MNMRGGSIISLYFGGTKEFSLDETRIKNNGYALIQSTIKGLANNAKNMYKVKNLKYVHAKYANNL